MVSKEMLHLCALNKSRSDKWGNESQSLGNKYRLFIPDSFLLLFLLRGITNLANTILAKH